VALHVLFAYDNHANYANYTNYANLVVCLSVINASCRAMGKVAQQHNSAGGHE